jgi:predicted PhzF superfamily epimerase YddE/YHI9
MPVPLVVVDAFTGTAFAGNPAPGCAFDTAGDARNASEAPANELPV